MKKINVHERLIEDLPEGKRMPSSLESDLRDASLQFLKAMSIEDVDNIMSMSRFSQLRNRIKSALGVSVAKQFDNLIEELKK